MLLKEFTVKNFRNIIKTSKLLLQNYTLLIGGNNQGKTNYLKAINTAFNIIKNQGNISYNSDISFDDDYPISKKDDSTLEPMVFELSFLLSKEEIDELKQKTGIDNNQNLSLKIELEFSKEHAFGRKIVPDVNIVIKNKRKSNQFFYNLWIDEILKFINNHFGFVYIPAIRDEDISLSIINDLVAIKIRELNNDNDYQEKLNYVYEKERTAISTIKDDLLKDLKEYLPEIKDIDIDTQRTRRTIRNAIDFIIDDGNKTSISNKGDGVISLIYLALIQGKSKNSTMFAIEEPESHLHADAIHKISSKLIQASETKQIIISSHNPSFVVGDNLNHTFLKFLYLNFCKH